MMLFASLLWAGCGSARKVAGPPDDPAGKLVVSANKAGGAKSPFVQAAQLSVFQYGVPSLETVRVINPARGYINGADVVINYDPAMVRITEVSTTAETRDFILVANDRVAGQIKIAMAAAIGSKEDMVDLFQFYLSPAYPAVKGATTTVNFSFHIYNEEATTVAVQRVQWQVRVE